MKNKFSSIAELAKDNIDVLLISETKIDSFFPSEQFAINNYKIFRRDRNCFGPTCFQSSKPTYIDLIHTNKKELFKNSKTFEFGISDHRLLTLTSMRIQFIKGNPKVKFYRDYKSFNFEFFNNDLDGLLKAENNINYSIFQNIFLQA